ncbi:MAG: metallophosphoesterase family protein, partial [Chloroflexota bacterium]
MFDHSFLPPAGLEFVVLADTHHMVDPGDAPLEFESRRKQTTRAEHALRLAASLEAPFLVHLGDLIQEFPGTSLYARALAEVRAQLARHGVRVHHVAGNHEVGDKPDPTMPTPPVTREALAAYHDLFGPSWYSFDAGGVHFVVLNSSILNAALPEAVVQHQWLEADLAAHHRARVFVFMHHPPYLYDAQEPALGHYDNVSEPDRSWLLGLIRRHGVEMLFAGHSHFAWLDRIGRTRYVVATSTSFTRPGFSEVFSSGPPDERGRDDAGKLGFYLVRVQDDGTRVHFIRTRAAEDAEEQQAATGEASGRRLLTRLPRDLPHSPLGVTLLHPLAHAADVPLAWPSVVRQRVRNDYPLLSLLELGVRHVRVPASDLDDPLQGRRLAVLRDEGVSITAAWLWSAALDLPAAVARLRGQLDTVEVQIAGQRWPPDACLEQLRRCAGDSGLPITLAPVLPNERVAGKQHPRTRIGYHPSELAELDRHLARHQTRVDRVLCRIGPGFSPWDVIAESLSLPSFGHIGAVDWGIGLPA